MRFQGQEYSFEYTAKNCLKKYCATQELKLVEYFKPAAALHYGLTKQEVLIVALQYGKIC
jgi:hypothetical protein